VGRKVVRDGGAMAMALSRQMRATLAELKAAQPRTDGQGLGLITRNLEIAIDAYEKSTRFVLEHIKDATASVYLGSVPYLMLAGTVHAGWQMARAALRCAEQSRNGRSTDFHTKKLACCVAYATYVLPRTQTYLASILGGAVLSSYSKSV